MHTPENTPPEAPRCELERGMLCVKIGRVFTLLIPPNSTGIVLVIVVGVVLSLVVLVVADLTPVRAWLRALGVSP